MKWVYLRTEKDVWTVGFYDGVEEWQSESDHATADKAAERCNYLNGERSKGCDYCKKGKLITDQEGFELDIHKDTINIADKNYLCLSEKINK